MRGCKDGPRMYFSNSMGWPSTASDPPSYPIQPRLWCTITVFDWLCCSVGAYRTRVVGLAASQPSPLHTLPHHSCSSHPPRACLALHTRTCASALIAEGIFKAHRYPCVPETQRKPFELFRLASMFAVRLRARELSDQPESFACATNPA